MPYVRCMAGKKKKPQHFLKNVEQFRLRHRILTTCIGIIGVILIWRGIWTLFDTTPLLSSPFGSIVFGLLLVATSGVFFKLI